MKNFDGINFDLKKYHRYYIKAMILSEQFIDIPSSIKEFKKDTGLMLALKKEEINTLKSQLTDNYNNMSLLELINNIKDVSIDLEVKTSDMKYKYKNKKKLEERAQKIILFDTKESLENLNTDKNNEFF